VPAQPVGDRPQRGRRGVRELSGRAPTARRMIFGRLLRQLRIEAGLNERDTARLMKQSSSKISRLEGGFHDFKEPDVERLLDITGVADQEERERLLVMARQANEPGWWDQWSDVSTKSLQTHVSLEDIAQRIRSYEMQQIVGLLQIPDYAKALVQANSDRRKPQIDRIVELREMRQRKFLDESKAHLLCIIDEVTLVRGYGTEQTMRRQIDHLISLADHPRVNFRLVELSRHNLPVQVGTTTVFDFEDGQLPDIVYLESANGGRFLQEPEQVDEHAKAFDRLLVTSMNQLACVRRMQHYSRKYR
jgi:transcriptional regulator with XRE-family HTH domain